MRLERGQEKHPAQRHKTARKIACVYAGCAGVPDVPDILEWRFARAGQALRTPVCKPSRRQNNLSLSE